MHTYIPPSSFIKLLKHYTFFFIRNLCGGVETEVSFFLKESELHSSLIGLFFLVLLI